VGYTVGYGNDPPNGLLARGTCHGKTCLPDRPGPGSEPWDPPDGPALLEESTLTWEPQDWEPHVWSIALPITTVCEKCPGDIDCDGRTAQSDLGILLGAWGKCVGDLGYDPCADLDKNGCVHQSDLGILLADWGCNVDP
jgi:hypothetical protein